MPSDKIVQQLLATQNRLYAYIVSLIGDLNAADDILQEANVVLLKKSDQFIEGTDFGAWACRVAHYQCLAHRQQKMRSKLLFDDEMLREVAERAEVHSESLSLRQAALRQCLADVSPAQRKLLEARYAPDASVTSIAKDLGRPTGSIYQTLHRLRSALLACIERRLTEPDNG